MGKKHPQTIRLGGRKKSAVRTQFGALCYRIRNDEIQVLLVTSRRRKRWIIPKGWPMDGATPSEAAMREAWEEAGVKGSIKGGMIGIYSYRKDYSGKRLACLVVVFAVKVKSTKKNYPEAGQRRRKWVSVKKAAKMLDDVEMRYLVKSFDPRSNKRAA